MSVWNKTISNILTGVKVTKNCVGIKRYLYFILNNDAEHCCGMHGAVGGWLFL